MATEEEKEADEILGWLPGCVGQRAVHLGLVAILGHDQAALPLCPAPFVAFVASR